MKARSHALVNTMECAWDQRMSRLAAVAERSTVGSAG
jgi:hypothetical protein